MEMLSNVLNNDTLKTIYMKVLNDLSKILSKSYGPYGSNTLIQKGANAFPIYTKDGHTILQNVKYINMIERTITSNILSITEYIVRHVGDGTTSAVLLSREILKGLYEFQQTHNIPPVRIVETFKKAVNVINKEIENNGREFDIKDAYKIALISTNGDEDISKQIQHLYDELGSGVYISLNTTNQKNDVVSIYDGLVLETGLIEECYINDPMKKICHLERPQIYAFTDPVDTPEMIRFFECILFDNIFRPISERVQLLNDKSNKKKDTSNLSPLIPTVIIAPKLSRDASQLMEKLTQSMTQFTGASVNQRPPVLVITNIESVDRDQYADIIQMCGCPPIKKYINPEVQKQDQDNGVAPTFDNVSGFYGIADVVECDHYKTSFIRPRNMFDKDGNTTENYKALISFLDTEIAKATEEKLDVKEVYHLKKRLNSLKASFVEWYVGGVSPSDRDQRYAAIEDAVKNVRSAARDGVGFGANYEGFIASKKVALASSGIFRNMTEIIYEAYKTVIEQLYANNNIGTSVNINVAPVDITGNGRKVLSSIKTDQMILEGISNLITIMATSNQYICPEPIDTAPYRAEENVRKLKEARMKEGNQNDNNGTSK